MIVSSSL